MRRTTTRRMVFIVRVALHAVPKAACAEADEQPGQAAPDGVTPRRELLCSAHDGIVVVGGPLVGAAGARRRRFHTAVPAIVTCGLCHRGRPSPPRGKPDTSEKTRRFLTFFRLIRV
jgi:hypothetical protein